MHIKQKICFLVLVVLFGCTPEPVLVEFRVSHSALSFDAQGLPDEGAAFTVYSSHSWTVHIPEGVDWISCSPPGAAGTSKVALQLQPSAVPRACELCIVDSQGATLTIAISQYIADNFCGTFQPLSENGHTEPILWNIIDRVGLYGLAGLTAENVPLSLGKGANTATAHFGATDLLIPDGAKTLDFYYPYRADVAYNNGVITASLSSEQTAHSSAAAALRAYGLALSRVGVATGTEADFVLQPQMSFIRMQLWHHNIAGCLVKSVTVEAPNGFLLTGAYTADFGAGLMPVSGSRMLTLSPAAPMPVAASQAAARDLIGLGFPANLSGQKLSIVVVLEHSGGGLRSYRGEVDGRDLQAGQLHSLAVNLAAWEIITPVSTHTGNLAFWEKLTQLEAAATTYANTTAAPAVGYSSVSGFSIQNASIATGLRKDWLVASYIRSFAGYSGANWDVTAGKIEDGFKAYVQSNYSAVQTYFSGTSLIRGADAAADSDLDLRHGMATLSALMATISTTGFPSAALLMSAQEYKDLAGWAGDLQTFLRDNALPNAASIGFLESDYITWTYNNMGLATTTYSWADLLADMDALHIYELIKSKGWGIAEACRYYYSHDSGYLKRFSLFVKNRMQQAFLTDVLTYTRQKTSGLVQYWPLYGNGYSITRAQTHGIAKGYVNFILEQQAKEY